MGSFCYTCKKKLRWGQKTYPHSDIIAVYPTLVPVGLTFEDTLCSDCMNDLAKQAPVEVPQDEIFTEPQDEIFTEPQFEYNTKKQKNCNLIRESDGTCIVYFEISSIKREREFMDSNLFSLSSECPFFYQFLTWKKSKLRKTPQLNSRFWVGTPPSEWDASTWTEEVSCYDKFSTFEFDSNTGKLIIETNEISKNSNLFEIQLKFANQALIISRFLLFIDSRKKKINDKTIKEIKLKNNSEKIKLEKNSDELNKNEEVLADFFKSVRVGFDKDSEVISNYTKFRITNFRIINDVWYNPIFFIQNNNEDIPENSIFNFTHDEYDDVIASNVKKTREEDIVGGVNSRSSYWNLVQNSVDLSHNESKHHASSIEIETGDIIFMLNGKKLWTWENFEDPKGIVEMIKSAKAQFESQDEKIPEPQVSSSDDDPLKILKIRLAKGEITLEEFNEIKENLV
jgi:hypothetical protein